MSWAGTVQERSKYVPDWFNEGTVLVRLNGAFELLE